MANGWTPERRSKQAALIRTWKPWSKSSGPQTIAGKRKSAQNAYKHGGRSYENLILFKRIKSLLKEEQNALNQLIPD